MTFIKLCLHLFCLFALIVMSYLFYNLNFTVFVFEMFYMSTAVVKQPETGSLLLLLAAAFVHSGFPSLASSPW